jgi:hypothetical protein
MLGITIRLGASKDQIVNTATREVLLDRYALRNNVKRVQFYKPGDNTEKPRTKYPVGMEYVPAPYLGLIKTAEGMIRQRAA